MFDFTPFTVCKKYNTVYTLETLAFVKVDDAFVLRHGNKIFP